MKASQNAQYHFLRAVLAKTLCVAEKSRVEGDICAWAAVNTVAETFAEQINTKVATQIPAVVKFNREGAEEALRAVAADNPLHYELSIIALSWKQIQDLTAGLPLFQNN